MSETLEAPRTASLPELACATLAFLLPLIASPRGLAAGYWSPRQIVLCGIALAAPGLLAAHLIRRERAAIACAAFLVWASICTALSSSPDLSFWGPFGIGTGLLFLFALATCWSLGRLVRSTDMLERALLATAVTSVAIGVLQVLFDLSPYGMGLPDGRADAMTGNAVFLAGLLGPAAWVAATHSFKRPVMRPLLLAVVACGVELAGGRIALAILVIVLIAVKAAPRPRLVMAIAMVIGLGVGNVLAGFADTESGAERLVAGGSYRARLEMWRVSPESWIESPLTGAGPGLYQAATSSDRTLRFVHEEGPGRYFFDAHNFVIEFITTTGLIGFLLLAWWILRTLRGGDLRHPLTGFALLGLVGGLVQPQNLVVTPLIFLALGAGAAVKRHVPADGTGSEAPPSNRLVKSLTAVGAIAGVALMGWLGIGFARLELARLDFEAEAAEGADRFLTDAWWPPREQRARIDVLRARERNEALPRSAVEHRRAAAEAVPSDPRPLLALADSYLQVGDRARAGLVLAQVLEVDPWNVPALNALGRQLARDGDPDSAVTLLRRSLQVFPDQPRIRDELERAESAT